LLSLLVRAFAPDGPLILGLDDTIERRWGAKIAARGIYRDPVRSSQNHFVKASGLRWLCLMLLVPIPWAARVWALPFLTALCPSERYHDRLGKRHKTLTDWARQLVKQVRRWLPGRQLVIVADSTFSALHFLAAARCHATVITRLRLDAALYASAPPRRLGQRGRTPVKGPRLPALRDVLADPATQWTTLTIPYWYGKHHRQVDVASATAVWYHKGMPAVPLCWVLIRDPLGQFETQALLCTDQHATPSFILECFVQRWQIEVTFEEARAHLGSKASGNGRTRQLPGPRLACSDCIPSLPWPHSISIEQLGMRSAAWYAKQQPTFSDTMASVRR
jgi:hypothetical protein